MMPDIISVAVYLVVTWALTFFGRPVGRVLDIRSARAWDVCMVLSSWTAGAVVYWGLYCWRPGDVSTESVAWYVALTLLLNGGYRALPARVKRALEGLFPWARRGDK